MASIIPSVVADAEFQLATAVSIGSTSFTLASATDDDGVALPSAVYCFTIDNGSSNKEYLQGLLNGVDVTAVKSISRQTAQTTGAVRAHRVGSPCIISDFSTIAQVAKVMNGLGALDGASPLIYDVEPTISDRKQIATLGKVLDLVTGGTVTFDNQTLSGVLAGETIVAGNSVYLKESDQRWWLTDADTIATVENVRLGIALGSGSAGVAITGGVLLEGAYTTTGLTAGARYYLGNTAGALSATVGTNPMVVGLALSTTRLLFSPSRFSVPTFNEKAALAGGGAFGTPSGSNKFLTQEYFTARTIRYQYDLAGSPFTWTKMAGLKYIIVEAWGGGGNASVGGTASRYAAGGGGGYTKRRIEASSLGATETVTVGGSAANSTFGALVTGWKGGNGGVYSGGSTVSGGGGGGVGNDGTAGENGADTGNANGGLPGNPISGTGFYNVISLGGTMHGIDGGGAGGNNLIPPGNSLYGGGGGAHPTYTTPGKSAYGGNGGTTSTDGVVPGGGGGTDGTTAKNGGAGRIIVTEYYS